MARVNCPAIGSGTTATGLCYWKRWSRRGAFGALVTAPPTGSPWVGPRGGAAWTGSIVCPSGPSGSSSILFADMSKSGCVRLLLPGVLIVDRYHAYHRAPCKRQYCYAPLMRDVEDLAQEFPDQGEVQAFTSALIPLLSAAMHPQLLCDAAYYEQARGLQQHIQKVIEAPAQHLGVRGMQDLFRDNAARLYHWVEDRRVPADNNHAER